MTDAPQTYEEYHQLVVAAIRKRMLERWPPHNRGERIKIAENMLFFDAQCSYEDEFEDGLDPMEMADDQLDAAAS